MASLFFIEVTLDQNDWKLEIQLTLHVCLQFFHCIVNCYGGYSDRMVIDFLKDGIKGWFHESFCYS